MDLNTNGEKSNIISGRWVVVFSPSHNSELKLGHKHYGAYLLRIHSLHQVNKQSLLCCWETEDLSSLTLETSGKKEASSEGSDLVAQEQSMPLQETTKQHTESGMAGYKESTQPSFSNII